MLAARLVAGLKQRSDWIGQKHSISVVVVPHRDALTFGLLSFRGFFVKILGA